MQKIASHNHLVAMQRPATSFVKGRGKRKMAEDGRGRIILNIPKSRIMSHDSFHNNEFLTHKTNRFLGKNRFFYPEIDKNDPCIINASWNRLSPILNLQFPGECSRGPTWQISMRTSSTTTMTTTERSQGHGEGTQFNGKHFSLSFGLKN